MACLVSVLILERISFSWTKEPMEPLLRCMEWTALFCSSSLTIKARTAAFYQSGLPVWQCWECPAGSCGQSATCLPSDCAGRSTNSRRRSSICFSRSALFSAFISSRRLFLSSYRFRHFDDGHVLPPPLALQFARSEQLLSSSWMLRYCSSSSTQWNLLLLTWIRWPRLSRSTC